MLMAGGGFPGQEDEFEDEPRMTTRRPRLQNRRRDRTSRWLCFDEIRSVQQREHRQPHRSYSEQSAIQVNADGLPVPSTLQGVFEGAMDTSQLLPGQTVEIRLTGPVNPGSPVRGDRQPCAGCG